MHMFVQTERQIHCDTESSTWKSFRQLIREPVILHKMIKSDAEALESASHCLIIWAVLSALSELWLKMRENEKEKEKEEKSEKERESADQSQGV